MTPAALAALHAACFRRPRPWTAAEFAALLGQRTTVLAALPDGFALGRVAADEAELLTLAVAPHARRRGLGGRLLALYEAEAQARGARTSVLEVAADNLPARALYAVRGYAEAGRRPGYYGADAGAPEADAILLQRPLGGAPTGPAGVPESC